MNSSICPGCGRDCTSPFCPFCQIAAIEAKQPSMNIEICPGCGFDVTQTDPTLLRSPPPTGNLIRARSRIGGIVTKCFASIVGVVAGLAACAGYFASLGAFVCALGPLIGSLAHSGLLIGIAVVVAMIVYCRDKRSRAEALGAALGFGPLGAIPNLLVGWIEWLLIPRLIAGFNQVTGSAIDMGWLSSAIAGGALGLLFLIVMLIVSLFFQKAENF